MTFRVAMPGLRHSMTSGAICERLLDDHFGATEEARWRGRCIGETAVMKLAFLCLVSENIFHFGTF